MVPELIWIVRRVCSACEHGVMQIVMMYAGLQVVVMMRYAVHARCPGGPPRHHSQAGLTLEQHGVIFYSKA